MKKLLLSILLVASSQGLAEEDYSKLQEGEIKPTEDLSQVEEKENIPHRPNALGLSYVANYYGMGWGVNYDRNFSKKFMASVAGSYGNNNNNGEQFLDSEELYSYSNISASLGLKYFIFYNFYIATDFAYTRFDGEYGVDNVVDTGKDFYVDFNQNTYHVDFYVGTRWKIKRKAFLKIDWVGYSLNVSNDTNVEQGELFNYIVESLYGKSIEDKINEETNDESQPFYMRFTIGVLF